MFDPSVVTADHTKLFGAKLSPDLIAAKVKLSVGLDGDTIGQDANHDGFYKGKSLELWGGGRSLLLHDRLVWAMVQDGIDFDTASKVAKAKVYEHGIAKYGKQAMMEHAHG